MKEFIVTFLVLITLTTVSNQAKSQQAYSLMPGLELKVAGTSTIHDWEMVSSSATGEANLESKNDGTVNFSSLFVSMPVKSLKSGKSQMDANAYKALKADKFPEIQFTLTDVKKIAPGKVIVNGKLTIAGTSRSISIEANYNLEGDSMQFTGARSIKFSEFNIDPPAAIFGTIKTGDDLQLSFNVIFKLTTKITRQ
jgi:polyisoprenoid-binding protein YceI